MVRPTHNSYQGALFELGHRYPTQSLDLQCDTSRSATISRVQPLRVSRTHCSISALHAAARAAVTDAANRKGERGKDKDRLRREAYIKGEGQSCFSSRYHTLCILAPLSVSPLTIPLRRTPWRRSPWRRSPWRRNPWRRTPWRRNPSRQTLRDDTLGDESREDEALADQPLGNETLGDEPLGDETL